MYWSWAWQTPETLLGILTCNNITITQQEDEEDDIKVYSADMISIGLLIGRIDIIINKEEKKQNNG